MKKIISKIIFFAKITSPILAVIASIVLFVFLPTGVAHAQFNNQINYQGRLTTPSGVAVTNGNYNIQFKLYTAATGGSAIWTETDCFSTNNGATCTGSGTDQRIAITNGLFSVMLGSTTPFTGVNFNQTLYLGVNIGGTGSTPSYDGEMSPRKILGAVPAAMYSATSTVALTLNGVSNTQFFRNDQQNSTSTSSTFLNILQSGAGKIAEFFGSATQSVLALLSNGNVGIGSSTPSSVLAVEGTTSAATTNLLTVASSSGATFFNVLANGNVGIGSSTPGSLLSVAGTAQITATSTLNGVKLANLTNTILAVDSSGNVVATSSAVLGTNFFANSAATTTLTTGSILSAGIGTFGTINATSTTGNSTFMGNVGIDTATPLVALTVATSTNSSGNLKELIRLAYTGDPTYFSSILSSTGGTPGQNKFAFYITRAGTQFTPLVLSDTGNTVTGTTTFGGGNVGIGSTTPGTLLTVQGNAYFGGNVIATGTLTVSGHTTLATASSTGLTVTGTSTLTGVKITNLANTFLALDTSGNLIATTTPVSTNFFSNSGATTTLTTGSSLVSKIITATSSINVGATSNGQTYISQGPQGQLNLSAQYYDDGSQRPITNFIATNKSGSSGLFTNYTYAQLGMQNDYGSQFAGTINLIGSPDTDPGSTYNNLDGIQVYNASIGGDNRAFVLRTKAPCSYGNDCGAYTLLENRYLPGSPDQDTTYANEIEMNQYGNVGLGDLGMTSDEQGLFAPAKVAIYGSPTGAFDTLDAYTTGYSQSTSTPDLTLKTPGLQTGNGTITGAGPGSNGYCNIAGVGTNFTTQLAPTDIIYAGSQDFSIVSITDDTDLVTTVSLDAAANCSNAMNSSFSYIPFQFSLQDSTQNPSFPIISTIDDSTNFDPTGNGVRGVTIEGSGGSLFGGYSIPLTIRATQGNTANVFIDGRSGDNPNAAFILGACDEGGGTGCYGLYYGSNNYADMRMAPMNTVDQTGYTNAKDGNLGITVLNASGDNGTEGNVGINQTSPQAALDVGGDVIDENVTSCSGSNALNTDSNGKIVCGATSGGSGNSAFTIGNGFIYNATSSNEVGIGSSTPISTLAVEGNSSFPTRDLFDVASSTGTNFFNISANGNVGIGSSTPGALLGVQGNLAVAGGANFTNYITTQGLLVGSPVGGGVGVYENNTTPLQIGSQSGYEPVIIGDYQDANNGGGITVSEYSNTNTNAPIVTMDGPLELFGNGGNPTNITDSNIIDAGGAVAIGTSYSGGSVSAPGNGLIVSGSTGIGTSTVPDTLTVQASAGTNPFIVSSSSGAQFLSVLKNGNVGIGSTTPGSLLAVGGNAYFGGNITATGTLTVSGQTTLANASTTNITASGNLTAATANIGSLSGILFGTNGVVGTTSTSSLGLAPAFTAGTGLSFTGSVLNSVWEDNPIISPQYADSGSLGINDGGGDLSIVGNGGAAHIEGVSSDPGYLTGSSPVGAANIPLYINSDVSNSGGPIGNVYIASAIGDADGGNVYLSEGGAVGSENAGNVYVGQGNAGANGNLIVYGSAGIGTTSPIASLAVTAAANTNPFAVASSSGKQYFNILANGNVGIGSSTPGSLLAVGGNAFFGGNVTATGTLSVSGVGTSTISGGLSIGTTSVSSGYQLTIANNLTNNLLELDGSGLNKLDIQATGTNPANTFAFVPSGGSTQLLQFVSSGDFSGALAVGTTTAVSSGLYVAVSGAGSLAGNFINASAIGSNGINIQTGSVSASDYALTIKSNAGVNNIFTVTNAGNVGIGSSTPGSLLSVAGTAQITATSTLTGLKLTNLASTILAVDASGNVIATTSLAATPITWTLGNGFIYAGSSAASTSEKVGVGTTSPIAELSVEGTSSQPTEDVFDVASSSNANIFTIKSNGNVGIGSTVPGSLLTVAGTFNVTGQTTLGNASTTALTVSGQTTLASALTGLLQANSGVVSSVATIGIAQGGTNATSQVTHGINFFNGTSITSSSTFVAMPNGTVGIGTTTPGVTLDIPTASTTNSILRVGTMEFSSYALNNSFFGDNTYYNGTSFIRRNTGYGGLVYFDGPEMQFRLYSSSTGSTGINSGIAQLKLNQDGTFAVGPAVVTPAGTYTGATFMVTSAGLAGVGSSTPTAVLSVEGTSSAPTNNLFAIASSSGKQFVTVLAAGNVGIGSTTPGSLLAVGGNAYFGGNVTATGTLTVTGQTTLATASSTGLTVTATSTLTGERLTNLASTFLAVDAHGNVIATTTPGGTNYWTLSGSNLYNNSGTNVGIGTTSSSATVDLVSPNTITGMGDITDNGMGQISCDSTCDFLSIQNLHVGDVMVSDDTGKAGSIMNIQDDSDLIVNPPIGASGGGYTYSQPQIKLASQDNYSNGTNGQGYDSDATLYAGNMESPIGENNIGQTVLQGSGVAITLRTLNSQYSSEGTEFIVDNEDQLNGAMIINDNNNLADFALSGACAIGTMSNTPCRAGIRLEARGEQYPDSVAPEEMEFGNFTGIDGTPTFYIANDGSHFVAVDGSMGINTGTPGTALDVNGDITDENVVSAPCLATDSTGKLISTSCGSGNSAWTIGLGKIFNATSSNYVSIGTSSPFAKLYVLGTLGSSSPIFTVASTTSTAGATSSLLTVLSNGNVGIGTTTPGSALDVGGNVTDESLKSCDSGTQAVGTTASGTLVCDASLSDERLKNDITSLGGQSALNLIDSLNPVSFYWKDPSIPGTGSTAQQFGFIAQQVQQIAPNLVATTTPTYLTPDQTYYLNYQGIIAPLVAAVQQQELQINVASSTLSSTTATANSNVVTLTSLSSQVGSLVASMNASTTQLANAISALASSTASTTANLQAQITTLSTSLNSATSSASSSTDIASSTAATLSASSSFIQTITNAVIAALNSSGQVIQSTGNWVVGKLSATTVITNDVQTQTLEAQAITTQSIDTQTANVAEGLEMKDQATGYIYCIQLLGGQFEKTLGTCASATSTTPSLMTNPVPTTDPTPVTSPTPTSSSTDASDDTSNASDTSATSTSATLTPDVSSTTATSTAPSTASTTPDSDASSTTPATVGTSASSSAPDSTSSDLDASDTSSTASSTTGQ